MRYFFHIAYEGTNYRGWQRLPGVESVQQTIEEVLSKVLKQKIEINGCGRTDAQVHSAQYFFHVDIDQQWDYDLKFRLNKALPITISIFDIIPVHDKAHARFDAYSRTYDYFIHSHKDPFLKLNSSCYDITGLNLELMNTAVKLLPKYRDFIAFCRTPDKHEHGICLLSEAKLYTNRDRDRLRLEISSNRFLKGMIRILVSKLMDIGSGKLSLEQFEAALSTQTPLPETPAAYPKGLFLSKVLYRTIDIPVKSAFLPIPEGGWLELGVES